jgi:hypothetical protein
MAEGSNWKDVADDFKRLGQILGALWSARADREAYGIWLLLPDGPDTQEIRADFSLAAARATEKIGLSPKPLPQALQHDPEWNLYCQLEEETARRMGRTADMSDAVPYGLGVIDRDAVDGCTRAWLELLRKESPAFRSSEGRSWIKGGTESATRSGRIRDVCGASAIYCTLRARDEIGARLISESQRSTPIAADPIGDPVLPEPEAVLDDLPPEFPSNQRTLARAALLRIHSDFLEHKADGNKCVRSAYDVLAEALSRAGWLLTDRCLREEIPGWVFTWGVGREWLEYPPYQTASGPRKRPITGYTSAVEPVPEAEMTEIFGRHKTTTWHKTKILKMLEGRITYWEADALMRRGSCANDEDMVDRPALVEGDQASAGLTDGTAAATALAGSELPVLNPERNATDGRGRAADGKIPAQAPAPPDRVFRRSGDFWQLEFGGKGVHVKHTKGMTYIFHLLQAPGQSLHSMTLLFAAAGQQRQPAMGSAGEVLDERAIADYRSCMEELEKRLAQAERYNDQAQKELAQSEMDLLTEQIGSAYGLGGRRRHAQDDSERVRKNVSNAISRAIESIREHHSPLGDHLDVHINCGSFASYSGDGVPWEF